MDNDMITKTQTSSLEKAEGDLVVAINKKIEDIQALFDEKQKNATKEDEENLAVMGKEVVSIIEGALPEEEVLKKLEDIRLKMQPKQSNETAILSDDKKEDQPKMDASPEIAPAQEELSQKEPPQEELPQKELVSKTPQEQEAVDIVHSAKRGIPLFISNHIKKVAESLGITILPADTPNKVMEKFEDRLSGTDNQTIPKKTIPLETVTENTKVEEVPQNKDKEIPLPIKKEEIIELDELGKSIKRRIEVRDLIFKEKQKNTLANTEKLVEWERELVSLEKEIPTKQKEALQHITSDEEKIVTIKEQINNILPPQKPIEEKQNLLPSTETENKTTPIPQKKPTVSDYILSRLG